jgi:L-alanine-DL-glutamate epimerase-like enolase superfamily enzyme
MIITKARVNVIRAPLNSPFRIATGQHDDLENVFFKIEMSDGIVGYGEAAVAPHITGESVAQTLANLKTVAAKIEGDEVSDPLVFGMEFRPFFKGNHAALAAFEMALLDACARSRNVPLWHLFDHLPQGQKPAPFVTDITIVIGSVEEARQSAEDFYQRGFRTFKIKVGRDDDEDLARIMAVAQAAPQAQIILDANQAFTAGRMLELLRQVRVHGIHPVLIEQPVPKADLDGLAEVTSLAQTLVCADESAGSLADVEALIAHKAVSAVNIKLMKTGIFESAEIAHRARAAGLELMLGAMMESALSITAAAHFAAGMGCFRFIDLDTTFFINGQLSHAPYLDGSGQFDLTNAGPGIGVEVG